MSQPVLDVHCPGVRDDRRDETGRIIADMRKFAAFSVPGIEGGLRLAVAIEENKLKIDVNGACGNSDNITLPVTSLRRLIKDYRIICDHYSAAVAEADPSKVESIDMGRKAAHDEGGEWLQEKLSGRIDGDVTGHRFLFSLVNVLYL